MTQDSLWAHGCYYPSWIQGELERQMNPTKNLTIKAVKADQGGTVSNSDHLVPLLKACAKQKDLCKGSKLHADILRNQSLRNDIYVSNALINMYATCGAIAEAQGVFNELLVRTTASWNALIAGYAQHGRLNEALNCFEWMQSEGLSPNEVTFIALLKACGSTRATDKCDKIHDEVVRHGLLDKSVSVGTALVDMYAKCGMLAKAQAVFDELGIQDVVSWTVLIAGYAQHGHAYEALHCFECMQCEGLLPNAVTFTCILKACGSIGAAEKSEKIHAEVVKQGLLEKDVILGTALVDMYIRCGIVSKARQVFDKIPVHDVVLWNALIGGYAQHGHAVEALTCFKQMQVDGLPPDVVTFTCILKACSTVGGAKKGEEIHAEVVRHGLLEKSIIVGNAFVDMYAKCDALTRAQEVFDDLPVRDVVSWTAMIAGYVQHGHGDEALNCFGQMQQEGFSPDSVTFLGIMKACTCILATEKVEEILAEVVRRGLLEKNFKLGSALVDMYAKCGAIEKAQEVFDELPVQNVASWNALMAGYAQNGHGDRALNHFKQMQYEGLSPDAVTFTVLLNACSHSGLVDEGQNLFENLTIRHGIIPTLEHHTCLVDLYGRAGRLEKALGVIEKIPPSDGLTFWFALMAACQKWGNVKLGKEGFKHLIQLEENAAAAYVCVSNIYAAAGMRERKQTRLKP